MKLLTTMVLSAAMLFAVPASATVTDNDCEMIESLARTTMKARQAGVPVATVMRLIAKQDADEEFRRVMRTMALMAYESPRYTTLLYQTNAENDFADLWAVACYREKGELK